ncbi:MAG: PaaI family thioesterase [Chloroflexota bacterium]
MSVPDFETWQKRWHTPERQRLGLHADRIEDGFAQFTVDLRYGDDREGDPLFAAAAITHALDVAAVSAVLGHIDEKVQQQNGTASLNVHFLRPLTGLITVEGHVLSWGTHDAVMEVTAHDEAGTLVAKCLSGYSLRPKEPPKEDRGEE